MTSNSEFSISRNLRLIGRLNYKKKAQISEFFTRTINSIMNVFRFWTIEKKRILNEFAFVRRFFFRSSAQTQKLELFDNSNLTAFPPPPPSAPIPVCASHPLLRIEIIRLIPLFSRCATEMYSDAFIVTGISRDFFFLKSKLSIFPRFRLIRVHD